MDYYIGCDLGGTNIKVGIVNVANGQVIKSREILTLARNGHEDIIRRMADAMSSLVNECKFDWDMIGAIGVSAPGLLDIKHGITLFLPNLHGQWRNIPLAPKLTEYLKKPAFLLNDVRAITYGEWAFGAGKGVENMVCFAIGTGVGGGVVVNNELVLGLGGTAGELGHITVEKDGLACGCGNFGCVETYASGPAISSMGMRVVAQGYTSKIADLCKNDLNKITPKLIAEAAISGDSYAKGIIEIAGSYLGIAACNVALVVGPDRIVISGGVSAAGDLLLDPIRREIKKRMFVMPSDKIEVIQGGLGSQAGIIGTAVWAAKGGKPSSL